VNPPLARVMKLSGSPWKSRPMVCRSWITTAEVSRFCRRYGVFTLGYGHPRVVAAVREQLDVMALSGRTMFSRCSDGLPNVWPS